MAQVGGCISNSLSLHTIVFFETYFQTWALKPKSHVRMLGLILEDFSNLRSGHILRNLF